LRAALGKLPQFIPAYADLAEAYERLGKPQEAEKALLAGLAYSPNHPTLVQPLAWFYQRNGKTQAAEKLLVAELKEHPDDVESRFRLGAIYRDSGRPEAAIQQFREAIRAQPDNAEAHNQLGMLYGGSAQMQNAIMEFGEAMRLDPKNEAYRKNLQIARSRQGQQQPVAAAEVRFLIIQTKSLAAAQTIWRKLQSGDDWNALAREYSVHPSARNADPVLQSSPNDLDPALARSLAALKTGEISKPVSSSGSYFILKRE
jgi:tetratricopeptide (TPR) repeat protein